MRRCGTSVEGILETFYMKGKIQDGRREGLLQPYVSAGECSAQMTPVRAHFPTTLNPLQATNDIHYSGASRFPYACPRTTHPRHSRIAVQSHFRCHRRLVSITSCFPGTLGKLTSDLHVNHVWWAQLPIMSLSIICSMLGHLYPTSSTFSKGAKVELFGVAEDDAEI